MSPMEITNDKEFTDDLSDEALDRQDGREMCAPCQGRCGYRVPPPEAE